MRHLGDWIRESRVCAMFIVANAVLNGCEVVNNCPLSASSNLRNAGITTDVRQPYRCEYTIYTQNSWLYYEAMYFAPSLSFVTKYAWTEAVNSNSQSVAGPAQSQWVNEAGCGTSPSVCAFASFYFPAGTGGPIDYPPPYGKKYRDYIRLTVEIPGDGLGNGQLTLNGTTGAMADVVGPLAITAPAQGPWSASMTADTLSFQYRWYVDGTQIGGQTDRTLHVLPYGESGSYSLMAVAELMDQTTDTITKTVSVSMGASWSGPTDLNPYETGTWQASGHAARYPITCRWFLDNSLQPEADCSISRSFEPVSTHWLGVEVTDARSITAYSGDWAIHTGCGPGCNDYFKVPPATPVVGSRQRGP